MSNGTPGAFVAKLSWSEVERRVQSDAIAILPIGAASKEHGQHLPMQTDLLQAEWLAGALVQRRNVLVWPTVNYGYYPAFIEYAGSVSLTSETFQRMVREILGDIQRTGVNNILIVNTGISTIKALQAVVAVMSKKVRVKLTNVYDGQHYSSEAAAIEQQSCGGHADELETSILLAIDRQNVSLDMAVTWTPATMASSGPFSRDPGKPRFSPTGVWGDPTLASEEKGRRLLAAMIEDLLVAVDALQK